MLGGLVAYSRYEPFHGEISVRSWDFYYTLSRFRLCSTVLILKPFVDPQKKQQLVC